MTVNNVSSRIMVLSCFLLVGCNGSSGSGSAADSTPPVTVDTTATRGANFVSFESGQVRPLALSLDGKQLLATNTPAGTVEIFAVNDDGLQALSSVPVGLEPVAVAMRNNTEAWVVNHLSDSISIVDLSQNPPRVIDTLLVGDEPRDIVFAGTQKQFAFISTAHRGQNGPDDKPIDAELFTPGVGRTDVWVFDATKQSQTLGGEPTQVMSLFGDTARSLEVSNDGSKVYVAVMNSGNKTTAIGENQLQKPGPVQSADGQLAPDTGLIVMQNGENWVDDSGSSTDLGGTVYNDIIPFSLPDYDIFVLSAAAQPEILEQYSGVGTTLFNMAVNPANDDLLVSNTEALNLNRFEGPGLITNSVRGDFVRNRISVIADGNVNIQELNSHIDRTAEQGDASVRALSIAQPMGMAVDAAGNRVYVAGFGSKKLFVYEANSLGEGTFSSDSVSPVALSGGGPTDVVLNIDENKAFVLTRFNNSVSVVNTDTLLEEQSVAMFNPEPAHVASGRQFLYAAENLSRFGDASCASCHVFGDTDGLAWDLGNPDAAVVANPNKFVDPFLTPPVARFHPMKGPMSTQSLKGLENAGPMHWRGDRTGENRAFGASLELEAFKEFNEAFVELLGKDTLIEDADMTNFAQFSLALTYPPNPLRALDNSLNAQQQLGEDIYFNERTTGVIFTCNDCHTIDPELDHFGTSGKSSIEGDDISQEFKVPHFRNLYQKVGKFGNTGRFSSSSGDFGEQIKGFGFMHDGNMDTLQNFFKGTVFRFDQDDAVNEQKIQQVVEFVMASDSNLAPIVGQQVTLNSNSGSDVTERVQLLVDRALVASPQRAECDLVAKGVVDGEPRGYLMDGNADFQSDRAGELVSLAQLKAIAARESGGLTFTCLPPGSGVWFGIDRDEDGVLNSDEN